MKRLILFIHGLGGDEESWGSFPNFLKEEGYDIDVEIFRYQTELIRPKSIISYFSKVASFLIPQKRLPKIQTIADLLKGEISLKYKKQYDEIYLVTHSMGGLIAQRYLYDLLRESKSLPISKLMLYAVPNDGSHLAKIVKLYPHEQIMQLDRDSDFLDNLYRDANAISLDKEIEIISIIASGDEVVDERSARGRWQNAEVVVVEGDHRSVIKPRSKEDNSYLALVEFLGLTKERFDEEKDLLECNFTPFSKKVFDIFGEHRLIVCYSQDFCDIADEVQALKSYARYRYDSSCHLIEVPAYIDDEKRFFSKLSHKSSITSANGWRESIKELCRDSSKDVLLLFSDIEEGDSSLVRKMATIIRGLQDSCSNLHALFVGRKNLANLVHGSGKLSPLNTAFEIFFPVCRQNMPDTTLRQIIQEYLDNKEMLLAMLQDGWRDHFCIWHHDSSLNGLFWKGLLIDEDGYYIWRDKRTREIADAIVNRIEVKGIS